MVVRKLLVSSFCLPLSFLFPSLVLFMCLSLMSCSSWGSRPFSGPGLGKHARGGSWWWGTERGGVRPMTCSPATPCFLSSKGLPEYVGVVYCGQKTVSRKQKSLAWPGAGVMFRVCYLAGSTHWAKQKISPSEDLLKVLNEELGNQDAEWD